MIDLSPAAQVIYDAFNRVGFYNEPSFETDRKALAAALRAAADQVKMPEDLGLYGNGYWAGVSAAETKLRTIAAELEGNHG